jgi:hypothetical protein
VHLPSAPIAIALPLVGSSIMLAFAYGSFRVRSTLSLVGALLVGMASAIFVFVLVVAWGYGLRVPPGFPSVPWLLAFPLLAYGGVLYWLQRRFKFSASSAVIAGAVGLAPLWILGMLVGLLVACSFGDCV